ncbi:hypothetical protein C8R44DRAFT_725212 [Mycena epipterygia]|nr:hypothetical protein C8R44DRAFT_725212 [Mycena epipterygia]
MALHKVFLAFLAFAISVSGQSENQFQTAFKNSMEGQPVTFQFHHPIKRVAVVGAGPSGLQATAQLVKHNFTVRLFDRAPHPGGNWQYSEETPVRESYPDRAAGEWREQWRPRPVWCNLFTNSPKVSTELPDVPYGLEVPWVLDRDTIQRHVRSFASHHCLNSNDYSATRHFSIAE